MESLHPKSTESPAEAEAGPLPAAGEQSLQLSSLDAITWADFGLLFYSSC